MKYFNANTLILCVISLKYSLTLHTLKFYSKNVDGIVIFIVYDDASDNIYFSFCKSNDRAK